MLVTAKMWRLTVLLPVVLAGCMAKGDFFPAAALASNDSQILSGPGQETDRDGQSLRVGGSAFGKYLVARHAEVLGDYATAAEMLAEVVREVPDQESMLRRVHLLMATEGRIASAREYAARIIETEPRAPFASVTLATEEIKNGDYDAAVEVLSEADLGGANRLVVPLLNAWALAGKGDTDGALEELDALGGREAFDVIGGLHAGLISDLAGRTEMAEEALSKTVESGAVPPLRVVEAYASFLSRQERWDEAQAMLDRFLVGLPDSILIEPTLTTIAARQPLPPIVDDAVSGAAEALSGVARALSREGNSPTALYLVQIALDLRSDDASTRLLLGQILQDQERLDLALASYDQVDLGSPYSWLARLSRAQVLEDQGQLNAAVDLLQGMIDERPERSDAAHTLGDLLRVNERFDEAVAAYDDAIARVENVGQRHWRLLYTRGIALERSKQWDRAEADFLTALDLEPDQPHVLNYLGYSWVEQGVHLDEAREMIEKAVDQRPRDGFIADSMGWVLYRLGDYEPAVIHLETAVALEPGDPVINDHLGDAYWLVGRFQEAKFQWQRALDAGPEPDLAAEIEAKLRGDKRPVPLPPGEGRDS